MASQAHFKAQQEPRQRLQTAEFKEACKLRAGIEGTISQAVCALEAQQSRYRGMLKTHLQHLPTAAAENLLQVIAWLNDVPGSATPKSHFALLAACSGVRQQHQKAGEPILLGHQIERLLEIVTFYSATCHTFLLSKQIAHIWSG